MDKREISKLIKQVNTEIYTLALMKQYRRVDELRHKLKLLKAKTKA